ncbi:uncharacterized protein LOC142336303 isoform X3 [Convolutriloba macropyga]|uniref:uncharacterized protein LOC142336303 isoform X3 n=1 Tax=Convolutriloba macropyga TaxID=536237 RepID=UPI003F5256AA
MLSDPLYNNASTFVNCGFCQKVLEDPIVLPCGHLYCSSQSKKCIANLLRGKRQLLCVMCNASFNLKPDEFKPNAYLAELILALSKLKTNQDLMCARHEKFQKVYFCNECKIEICRVCWRNHMKHSVVLTEVVKHAEFSERLKSFDPHRKQMLNKKRLNDVEDKIRTVQRLLSQVQKCHESLENERTVVNKLRHQMPIIRAKLETQEFDQYYEQIEEFFGTARKSLLHSTTGEKQVYGVPNNRQEKIDEIMTGGGEQGCGRSLHLNDSFNSSNRSTVHKQLPEVVEYILNHRNRKITSSATLDKRETKPTNQIAPIQTVCEKAAQTNECEEHGRASGTVKSIENKKNDTATITTTTTITAVAAAVDNNTGAVRSSSRDNQNKCVPFMPDLADLETDYPVRDEEAAHIATSHILDDNKSMQSTREAEAVVSYSNKPVYSSSNFEPDAADNHGPARNSLDHEKPEEPRREQETSGQQALPSTPRGSHSSSRRRDRKDREVPDKITEEGVSEIRPTTVNVSEPHEYETVGSDKADGSPSPETASKVATNVPRSSVISSCYLQASQTNFERTVPPTLLPITPPPEMVTLAFPPLMPSPVSNYSDHYHNKYSEIYTRSRDQDENWNDGRGLQTPRRNRDLIAATLTGGPSTVPVVASECQTCTHMRMASAVPFTDFTHTNITLPPDTPRTNRASPVPSSTSSILSSTQTCPAGEDCPRKYSTPKIPQSGNKTPRGKSSKSKSAAESSYRPKFKTGEVAPYYYYYYPAAPGRPPTAVTMASNMNSYEMVPRDGSVIEDKGINTKANDSAGGNLIVGAFCPKSSSIYQVKGNSLRKCLWKDSIDKEGNRTMGNIEPLSTVPWERPNYPRAVTLGQIITHDSKPQQATGTLIYVGGFELQEGQRIPTVWLVDSESLQPRLNLNIKDYMKQNELETMNFKLAAQDEVLVIHVVNTQYFYVYKNQRFVAKLKTKVPQGISQMELRHNYLFIGSASEETVAVFELTEKNPNKFKFSDKKPIWGPVKARKGVFVIPNDENDIVVGDMTDRNKMLLFNCSHKNQECFDTYECEHTLNKFGGIEVWFPIFA